MFLSVVSVHTFLIGQLDDQPGKVVLFTPLMILFAVMGHLLIELRENSSSQLTDYRQVTLPNSQKLSVTPTHLLFEALRGL